MDVIVNAKRNIKFGILNKSVIMVCNFATRTILIWTIGAEYLGLNSLFTSIVSVLSMAELGIGTTVAYFMYKPIAENNTQTVNALLYFLRKVYRIIGTATLVIGLILVPFLPKLISGSYPQDVNLTILYVIFLTNTVISYFLYAYLSPLIVAYQRDDVNSRINMLVVVCLNVLQIGTILLSKNYMLFAFLMLVGPVFNNLCLAATVKHMFPQYKPEGMVCREILIDLRKRVSGMLISRLAAGTRNSFDSICISMFINLTMTAIYSNYATIIGAVQGVLSIIPNALMGGVGNHVAVRSKEENFQELKVIDFSYMLISGWCSVCLLCLSQPFMAIWVGTELMLPHLGLILFCIYFYLLRIGDVRSMYLNASGLWWYHRYRSLAEMILNIILNFVLAYKFGIYGILMATILTMLFIHHLWGTWITFSHVLGKKCIRPYFYYHIRYGLATAMVMFITHKVCCLASIGLKPISSLIICLGICFLLPTLLYYLLYYRTQEFIFVKNKLLGKNNQEVADVIR